MLVRPPPGLWDSFWAEHASSDRPFHRLLWYIRFIFSYAYAYALAQMPRADHQAGRLLEVGCGSARTLHYLHRHLPESDCLAFDLSPQALRLVRQLSPAFRGTVADASFLPLAPEVCSLAFSIGLLEHFDRATAAEMVREMMRVTRGGGLVAVMVPWRSSFYNLVRQIFGSRWPFGHENPFRRAELVNFFRAQGLSDVRLHVIYFSTLLAIGRKPGQPE
jgi:SAM-dependent methyltransferase